MHLQFDRPPLQSILTSAAPGPTHPIEAGGTCPDGSGARLFPVCCAVGSSDPFLLLFHLRTHPQLSSTPPILKSRPLFQVTYILATTYDEPAIGLHTFLKLIRKSLDTIRLCEDVLKRPEHRLANGLAPELIDDLLAELAALIEPVELHFRWRPQVRDPGDEMVLEAAINGDADALVTYNVSDFAVAADRFGVLVLRPVDVLKKVKP